jgi:hypothetical protein
MVIFVPVEAVTVDTEYNATAKITNTNSFFTFSLLSPISLPFFTLPYLSPAIEKEAFAACVRNKQAAFRSSYFFFVLSLSSLPRLSR